MITATAAVPREIASQLLRAGTAIGSNLEEAIAAHSRRDLAAKQVVALREARECRFWLRLVLADQPSLSKQIEPLIDDVGQLIGVLTASVRKLRVVRAVEVVGAVLMSLFVATASLH